MRAASCCLVVIGSLMAPAAAHAERPVPGCLGTNFEDAAADAREAPSGLEVTGGFITLRDRRPVVNVSFTDLDLDAYPQADDLYKTVRVLYAVGGRRYIVQVTFSRLAGQGYSWGEGTHTTRRNSGMAHPGPDGVVEMDLPNVSPGATVTIGEIRTETYKAGGVEYEPEQNMLRRTIDLAQGTTQSLACPAAPASAPTSSTEPVRTPPAEPAPQPSAPAGQPPAGPTSSPAEPGPAGAGRKVTLRARRLPDRSIRLSGRAGGVRDGARLVILRGGHVVARTRVRDGRFSVAVRGVARGARLRARAAGLTSAPVRIR